MGLIVVKSEFVRFVERWDEKIRDLWICHIRVGGRYRCNYLYRYVWISNFHPIILILAAK